MLKVKQLISDRSGNPVANQFIIYGEGETFFQSYDSIIARIPNDTEKPIELDRTYWDYSRTTLKYLTQFLRHKTGQAINGKKDIQTKIDSGEYKLANLN